MALTANDFTLGSLTGATIVRNGFANVNLITVPRILEGDKTFVIKLRKGSAQGIVLGQTPPITIRDNSEFVSLTPNVTTFSEGDSVEFTLLTANAANNATLYFSTLPISGNVDSNDFFTSNVGSFTVVDNVGKIVLTANTDLLDIDEGDDQFKLQIRTQGIEGNIFAVSSDTIQIQDTSNTFRIESVEFSTSGPIIESESLRIIVRSINGYGNAAGSAYYTITGNASIFSGTTGEIIINDNYGEAEIIAESDVPSDEEREFTVQVRTGSIAGDIFAISENIIVTPYITGTVESNVSLIIRLAANSQGMIQGGSTAFDILTIGGTDGEILYYNTIGDLTNDDVINGNTGSTVVTNNGANIIFTAINPYSGNDKIFGVEVRRGSVTGTLLANTSADVVILSNSEGYIQATGGTIDDSETGYRKHIFTTSSIFDVSRVSFNPARNSINYLVVAGGGGGGSGHGGGGGAGGMLTGTTAIGLSGSYNANIGGGGGVSGNGANSDIFGITSVGGGGGEAGYGNVATPGRPGGSGGGAGGERPGIASAPGGTGTPGQGNPGGASRPGGVGSAKGGGGGGRDAAGTGAPGGAAGGAGSAWPFSPANLGTTSTNLTTPGGTRYFAGGGGGGSDLAGDSVGGRGGGGAGKGNPGPSGSNAGQPGFTNTGGGGGGGGGGPGPGSGGGPGIIVIRYPYA